VVRHYKSLSHAGQAFRCLKRLDVQVRPIRHSTEDHVRGHILLRLLAYYVEWQMRQAWAPPLFAEQALEQDRQRDLVATAQPSESVQKKALCRSSDGLRRQSFDTLLKALRTRCRNACRVKNGSTGSVFQQVTQRDPPQAPAFRLLGLSPASGN
jgi:hypothetical protein